VDHIKIDFSGAYLNSIYTNNPTAPNLPGCTAATCGLTQDLTGKPVDYAPKFQGDFAVEYDSSPFAGGLTAQVRGDVSYVDAMFTTNDNNPQGISVAHALLGARVNLISADKSWTLSVYGENLTDARYYTVTIEQPLAAVLPGVRVAATGASILRGVEGAPLTAGVSLKKTF
jgi:iron complex outermembrane receptor protein